MPLDIDSLAYNATDTIVTSPTAPTFGLMMFQMIVLLIVLSVLLYFLLYLVKKLNAKYKNSNDLYSFKLLENFYFSQKQGISAILFGAKLYIIGFSNNSVSVIDIIENEEIITQLTEGKKSGDKFPEILKKFFLKGK